MRDLYKALACLTLDRPVAGDITSDGALLGEILKISPKTKTVAAYERGPSMPNTATPSNRSTDHNLEWEIQPEYLALVQIDALLRDRGLFLAAYEIAEINRWATKTAFASQMSTIGASLKAEGIHISGVGPSELILIGVLIVDENVREDLLSNGLDLNWFGGPSQLDKLERVFREGGDAEDAAKKYFADGWSPEGCTVRQKLYQTMFHINM